jgi:uncharacterized protein (TIGR02118 family)
VIKVYSMLGRRPDLDHAQFCEHWRTTHRELAVRIRRTRRYAQAHGLERGLEGLEQPSYDGVAEVWLDSVAAASRSDPDLERYAKPDEPNFMSADGLLQVITEQRQLSDSAEGGVKALICVRRKADLEPDEFDRRWWALVGGLSEGCGGLTGLAAAVASTAAGPQPFDGIAEIWWPDLAACSEAWGRDGAGVLRELATVADLDDATGWLCEELRVTWPREPLRGDLPVRGDGR